ncbi:DUF2520 domain-containing protein [bacterium]|nr:DUF2520 domain-containing protein [bacterium]
MKYKISFVGSGNVAWNLAKALDLAGHTINQVVSRNEEHAKALAEQFGAYYGSDFSSLYNDSDFIILSVHDDAYADVIKNLSPEIKGIVCHTSGATDISVFKDTGFKCGVFYPLQSFKKDRILDFLNIPMMVESESEAIQKQLFQLADDISNKVSIVNSSERLRYHLAAVFANNFTNFMYVCAKRYLDQNALDFQYLIPLIQETAKRLDFDHPENLQTGPAKRGDKEVIQKQIDMLSDEELKKLYEILSQSIMTLN